MTTRIFEEILEIRDSGLTNMFDWRTVQKLAYDNGFYDLVCYIKDDPPRYFKFILSGLLPDGEENPAAATTASAGSSATPTASTTPASSDPSITPVVDHSEDKVKDEKGGLI